MDTIGGYKKDREYDMRGIMIPRVGDLLYYDSMDMQVIVLEVDDERFYDERFLPVGVILDISDDLKTLKIITPYFIKVNFDMKERISEKNMIKQLKSFVRAYTKDLFMDEIEDMKFNMTTTDDLNAIILNHDKIIHGLEVITNNNIQASKIDFRSIIKYDMLTYTKKDKLYLTYNLESNFNEIEFDENFEPSIKNMAHILDFKKVNPDKKIVSYVIPVSTVILD